MKRFAGFPAGRMRFTPLPDPFFVEALPLIDDLDELKVILFLFWFLNRQRGYPRYMTVEELASEGVLLSALRRDPDESIELLTERLIEAIERGVAHNVLLKLSLVGEDEQRVDYIFMNTALSRRAIDEVRRGELVLERPGRLVEPRVERPRPNIFALYEDNIGLLTPLIAEELKQADRDYPQDWIEEAFRIAVENNVRNWRYIRAILERWSRQGRDSSVKSRMG